ANTEQKIISMVGINSRWQHMGQSGFGEPTVDYPFGSHSAIQPMGQLNTNTQGYANQLKMLGLGQLNALAAIEDGPYLSQPRLHGLGQVCFRPADAQSSFGVQDSLQESTLANTPCLASENLCSKNLS
ncbi:hypothetical protein HAX54_053349, partial [Datura stramonium]|nr:hypothetical protein [Datura stramonium]